MKSISWAGDRIHLIDQTRLPHRLDHLECTDYLALAQAIKNMAIRGAPALGIAAAMGVALAAVKSKAATREALLSELEEARNVLAATRPTAVNLFWALERMMKTARLPDATPAQIRERLVTEALKVAEEDEQMCRRIGDFGASLVRDGDTILTHCNAGGLATGGYGTALGVIRSSHRQGKRIHVLVDETRPLLQGSRLTSWELKEEGIPFTLITDNMAGYFMKKGKVNMVVVGADRITARGDVANKIGTYTLAVLAKENGITFYCAAPTSTMDLSIRSQDEIVVEERASREVTHIGEIPIAPPGTVAANPAFDVTPHEYISAIITEKGILYPPLEESLRRTIEGAP